MTTIEIIGILITAIATILSGVWVIVDKVSNKTKNETEKEFRLQGVEKKINDLPCNDHSEHIKNISNIQQKVNSINEIVMVIGKWIMKTDNDMIDELAQKASPYTLTPVGKELLKISHGQEIISRNLSVLIDKIDEKEPKTALDVEDFAAGVLLENLSDEMFNDLKNYVYYEPETVKITDPETNEVVDIKISIPTLLHIMSIYLRDEYIKRRKDKIQVSVYTNDVESSKEIIL